MMLAPDYIPPEVGFTAALVLVAILVVIEWRSRR